jgi:hypothetical protein
MHRQPLFRPPQPVPRLWPGATVLLMATGPSLCRLDTDAVRSAATAGPAPKSLKVIAVGEAWRAAPYADALYHADRTWWDAYAGAPAFPGLAVTQDANGGLPCADRWGLSVVTSVKAPGISTDPAVVHRGYNSGFQALQLAIHLGAARIVLLGFDMKKGPDGRKSWARNRPPQLVRHSPYELFVRAFTDAAPQIPAGVEVVNASRDTALECFPRVALLDAIRHPVTDKGTCCA